MNRSQRTAAALAALCLALVTLTGQPAARHIEEGHALSAHLAGGVVAEADDAALVAARTGWGLEETRAHMRVQHTFGDLLAMLAGRYPETIAGGVMASTPGAASTISFKGTVPAPAADAVASSGIPVILKGGSRYSTTEIRQRSRAVIDYLVAAGHSTVGAAVVPGDRIEVTVVGAPSVNPVLPAELRDGVRITVVNGPVQRSYHSRGGAEMMSNHVFGGCTSGFTVIKNGHPGVTTAGHCVGIDAIHDHVAGIGIAAYLEDSHVGMLGDVQWRTTGHNAPAEYHATATEIRPVTSVKTYTSIAHGDYYCMYGRASNHRVCDRVYSTYSSYTANGVYIAALVAMDDDYAMPGDSGGPWSYENEAIGTVSGSFFLVDNFKHVFSVASLFPLAIGAWVQVQ
jgi:hypothetical protein